jgi:hypothetical protein
MNSKRETEKRGGCCLERLVRLPKWAQSHIAELEDRVRRAEATIPWTEPGMEWFTLLKDSEPETIWLCDRNGTHAIASIGKGDRVFVGRARKANAKDHRPPP